MKLKEVTIVIPIYKLSLSQYEIASIKRCFDILGHHPIVFAKPTSLTIPNGFLGIEKVETISFSDSFFRSIPAYNRLMLSEEFYKEFIDSKYILIHQTDAFIFSDTLSAWCSKDYDYIGAPWLLKPIYRFPPFRLLSALKSMVFRRFNLPDRSITDNKVGNGGLSLRKVDPFLQITRIDQEYIDDLLAARRHHTRNEDVFWGITAPARHKNFVVPRWEEALKFSFDKYPSLCYKLNNKELPFGCHAWFSLRMKKFWLDNPGFINKLIQ